MSNQLVGSVYQRIMDDVIESCQVIFEEDGINQQTLDDMRTTWQIKLSANHVATFPWEPPPVPQPMVANPTPVPSNVPRPQQVPSSGPLVPPISLPSSGSGGVRIKTEPGTGYDTQGIPQGNGIPNYGNTIAQQRAAQNLQQKFGTNANAQINQLHAQAGVVNHGQQPNQHSQNSNIQLPQQQQMSDEQRRQFIERQRQQQQRQYQNVPQVQQRPGVNNAQTDGAGDWDSMIAQRRAAALADPTGTYDADLTMKERVEQMSHQMEGGGLMMPLSEQPVHPLAKKRKAAKSVASSSSTTIPQYDGFGDDDDEADVKPEIKVGPTQLDEDAINSDLDDPDDNVVEEESEEGQRGQIMLCTYDKVQRVKNKWKCTLKDGVLHTGGKEYVFHKAQGEFEW